MWPLLDAWIPVGLISGGVSFAVLGLLSLLFRRGAQRRRAFIVSLVLSIVVALVGLPMTFWYFFAYPAGTLNEARAIVETHGAEVEQLRHILNARSEICWVEGRGDVESYACDTPPFDVGASYTRSIHHPLGANVRSAYASAAALLRTVPGRALQVVRDQKDGRITFMRFVVFEPGLFDSSPMVLGVWRGDGKTLAKYRFRECQRTSVTGWYVCSKVR